MSPVTWGNKRARGCGPAGSCATLLILHRLAVTAVVDTPPAGVLGDAGSPTDHVAPVSRRAGAVRACGWGGASRTHAHVCCRGRVRACCGWGHGVRPRGVRGGTYGPGGWCGVRGVRARGRADPYGYPVRSVARTGGTRTGPYGLRVRTGRTRTRGTRTGGTRTGPALASGPYGGYG